MRYVNVSPPFLLLKLRKPIKNGDILSNFLCWTVADIDVGHCTVYGGVNHMPYLISDTYITFTKTYVSTLDSPYRYHRTYRGANKDSKISSSLSL